MNWRHEWNRPIKGPIDTLLKANVGLWLGVVAGISPPRSAKWSTLRNHGYSTSAGCGVSQAQNASGNLRRVPGRGA